MKSHEWPKPLWHKEHNGVYMAANEQVYETACQSGRRTQMDPEPPFGLWGWSKTYITKSPYEVGQKRVLHGPKGTTAQSSSPEEERELLAAGWTLAPQPMTDEDMLTDAQKRDLELESMRQQLRIQSEAIDRLLSERDSPKKGKHKDD